VIADAWTRWALRRPRALALVVVAVTALATAAFLRVELITDVTQLVDTPGARTLRTLQDAFGLGERAYLLVESEEPDAVRLVRAGEALREALLGDPAVEDVRLGPPVDPDQALDALLLPTGPLFYGPGELPELERLLTREGMTARLEQQAERLALLGLGKLEAMVERDPLDLHRPLLRRVKSLEGERTLDPESAHTLSADRRALLVEVHTAPGGTASARAVVTALERAVAQVQAGPGAGLRIRGTGAAYLAEERERVIQADVIRGLSVSILLAAVLTAFVLRMRLVAVALILLPTLWGAYVGVGLFAVTRSELAVVSLACTSILLGLGVDFTVHLAAAARTTGGVSSDVAALTAVRSNRGALALAALTSGVAFAAFLTSKQGFLQELGLLTGLGLAACLVAALVVLPVLLARVGLGPGQALRDLGVVWLTRLATRWPRAVVSAAALVSLAALAALILRPPQLEGDLRRIHARESQPLATQAAIAEIFGGSQEAVLLLVEAADPDAALAALHRLDAPLRRLVREGVLSSRRSLAPLLPPRAEQEEVLALLARHDPAQVEADFRAALEAVGFESEPFEAYARGLGEAVRSRAPLDVAGFDGLGLAALRAALLQQVDGAALALVQVFPARDPWSATDRAALLGALDGAVAEAGVTATPTGLHVVSSESAREVAADFTRICALTVGAVLLVLVLRLRHPGLVLLALTPAALGTLWTAGVLAATDTHLNLMNLGVLPMVLAIGIDDGIHLLHRHLQGEGSPASVAFRATCAAVLLTSLTTMLTFGSLALSRNQGIASVGFLTFVGVGGSLLASILVFPALLRLLPRE
jgi:predicted RND superfamily exporter protein